MSNFEELTRDEDLYDVEGGLWLEVAGFVLAGVAFALEVYNNARDDAANAGKRDAYNDMYLSK